MEMTKKIFLETLKSVLGSLYFPLITWGKSSRTLYIALLQKFVRSGSLSAFIVMLGQFCNVKFTRGTSLTFSSVT